MTTSDQQDTGLTKISEFVFIDFKKQNRKKQKPEEIYKGESFENCSWEKIFPDSLSPSIAFLSL